jgi:hypothetical protein
METAREVAWGAEAGATVAREADAILRTLASAAPGVYRFEHQIDLCLRAMRAVDVVAVMRRVRERAPGAQHDARASLSGQQCAWRRWRRGVCAKHDAPHPLPEPQSN